MTLLQKGTDIVIASANKGKINEIRSFCNDIPLIFKSLSDVYDPIPSIEETGSSFEENARIKAQWVYNQTGCWTLADDSGLEVDYLNGEPGVHSARFAGVHATDAENRAKLLEKLASVPFNKRTCRFYCVMILLGPVSFEKIVHGTCEGVIGLAETGTMGFGYDPLFIPTGFNKTFAEIPLDQKNCLSHRAQALFKLREILYELSS